MAHVGQSVDILGYQQSCSFIHPVRTVSALLLCAALGDFNQPLEPLCCPSPPKPCCFGKRIMLGRGGAQPPSFSQSSPIATGNLEMKRLILCAPALAECSKIFCQY